MKPRVHLGDVGSGTKLFHDVLLRAQEAHPELGQAIPKAPGVFKKRYGDCLAQLEAARLAAPDPVAIARAMRGELEPRMRYGERPLDEVLAEPQPSPSLNRRGSAGSGAVFVVPFEGRQHEGDDAGRLLDRLLADHHMTRAAHARLHRVASWVQERGKLDLTGQKFVVVGAAAELSPAELLLRAGAEVLWVDPTPPPADLEGLVVHGPGDVLHDPQGVLSAIRAFTEDGPAHLGLFAYAPGKARELCLAEAMNATVRALEPSRVSSVSVFVSPTTPAWVDPHDCEVARARGRAPAAWQRALAWSRVLKKPGRYGSEPSPVARSVISLQGAGYQAAQYLSKTLMAEVLTHQGVRVSANVAGISRTRSLTHPLFLAAFEGAPSFGVRIFDADTTRALASWLMLHDLLLGEATPDAARPAQIHGGVYDLPWQFESAVRAAAVLGAARRPSLLWSRK